MSNFQFRQLDLLNEIEPLKKFHNRLFKNTDASSEWLLWYCTIHGKDKYARVYGVWDDSRLVGIWCVEPKIFQHGGKKIKVGRCFSVGIDDDYRRRNLFVELSKFAIQKEIDLGEFEYIFGFPQIGRSVVNAHIKAGWYHVQDIQMYSNKTKPVELTSLKDVNTSSSIEYLPLSMNNSFIETIDYKNTRWFKHPDLLYVCLKRYESCVIVKPYNNACHILDLYGISCNIKIILNALRMLAHRHKWQELTIWNADNERYHNDIIACEFVPGATNGSSVSMLAVNINQSENIKFDSCHIQMGVEEIY